MSSVNILRRQASEGKKLKGALTEGEKLRPAKTKRIGVSSCQSACYGNQPEWQAKYNA